MLSSPVFFMKRTWLLFAQAVTVLLAAYFVVATLKPEWLNRRAGPLTGLVSVIEAPAAPAGLVTAGSLSAAAKKASPAVVSINTRKAAQRSQRSNDPWFRFFFGDQGADQPQVGLGSGVIVSADGLDAGATITDTTPPSDVARRPIHSGLSVATTK